ncbi:unnamed protein product [Closterium sp. Yama58-4]|nr:unnamed protein product [Closterium sp. Yama58-4]
MDLDLEGVPEEDKARLTQMIENAQRRDGARMYNSLVERCFRDCVDNFRRKTLDKTEEQCVKRCGEKFLNHFARQAMEGLDGPVLFRVADATGDAVTTIANIASVSRAFARVARSELWPRYCLARAAVAEEGEAAAVAAVAARLVREAGSADAPRNAASTLARCMSACPGVVPACCNALREDAKPWDRWSREASTDFWSEAEEESGIDGGSVSVGGGKESEGALKESGSHFPMDSHVSDSSALSSALAARIFLDECFLPASPSRPSPLFPGEVEGDERGKAAGEGKGEGDERGKVREEGAQEGAAVLMAAGDCGREHEAEAEAEEEDEEEDEEEEEERWEVVRGAIAGFRHSRFHWMLQGQPHASSACPFCHDQAWSATALLKPTAHVALGCDEGDPPFELT